MIYLAAPFFNDEQLNLVQRIEYILDLQDVQFFSPRSVGVLQDMPKGERIIAKREVYNENIHHIKECSLMVAVIDDRDSGTMFEIGYAAALGKDIITVTDSNYGLNVMLAEAVRGHFALEDLDRALNDTSLIGLKDEVDVF